MLPCKTELVQSNAIAQQKISRSGVFEKQRVRWLEAQVNHFRRFLQPDVRKAKKNLNFWNKFIQTLLLPRSLYILVFTLFFLLVMMEWLFGIRVLFPSPL